MEPSRRILIVDDDRGSRALLMRMLSSAGYNCRETDNAIDALKLIREEKPDVLLLDFKMPGMDGTDALKQLRADPNPEIAQLPVIMLTGHGESEVQCLEAGADDFVIKPVKIEVLRARIDSQLRVHSLRLQLQQQNKDLEAWRRNHERDLAAARATQQSLIPQKAPQIAGWEIATCYRPVIEVGGDIYGWLPIRNDRWLFWIADATGHGASAALLTTLAKLLFHHAREQQDDAATIMEVINDDLRGIFGGRSFMSAMCVTLDPRTGRASVVGAGHPPLLVTRFGRGTEAIPSSSPPLGLMEQSQFEAANLELNPGDAFTLYTDGLFGTAITGRFRSTPTQLAGMINPFAASADALLQLMLKTAAHDSGDSPADDVAAVVVRRSN
ncbi:MAG TPA: fused response regulator/phosphatase [Verrucomicrobiae bacterium]|jgi:sigma-B regulation protein RsbU (phosphoserine phosphatase)|nr:fused response regulator/phosphatase [Verrucomicrobiae bacterium]